MRLGSGSHAKRTVQSNAERLNRLQRMVPSHSLWYRVCTENSHVQTRAWEAKHWRLRIVENSPETENRLLHEAEQKSEAAAPTEQWRIMPHTAACSLQPEIANKPNRRGVISSPGATHDERHAVASLKTHSLVEVVVEFLHV